MDCIDTDSRSDFVGKLVDTASSQGDLLVTLALATIGGLVALVLQIVLHNRSKDADPISLTRAWIMLVALVSLGISIFAGYMLQGGLLNTLPVLYGLKIDCDKVLMKHGSDILDSLAAASQVQFYTFLFGIAAATAFILTNSWTAFRSCVCRTSEEVNEEGGEG